MRYAARLSSRRRESEHAGRANLEQDTCSTGALVTDCRLAGVLRLTSKVLVDLHDRIEKSTTAVVVREEGDVRLRAPPFAAAPPKRLDASGSAALDSLDSQARRSSFADDCVAECSKRSLHIWLVAQKRERRASRSLWLQLARSRFELLLTRTTRAKRVLLVALCAIQPRAFEQVACFNRSGPLKTSCDLDTHFRLLHSKTNGEFWRM